MGGLIPPINKWRLSKMKSIEEILENGFYLVTANFDMAEYSDYEAETFILISEANKFAKSMKKRFLDEIPNGKLDKEGCFQDCEGGLFSFSGESKNGENFVTIRVCLKHFRDVVSYC